MHLPEVLFLFAHILTMCNSHALLLNHRPGVSWYNQVIFYCNSIDCGLAWAAHVLQMNQNCIYYVSCGNGKDWPLIPRPRLASCCTASDDSLMPKPHPHKWVKYVWWSCDCNTVDREIFMLKIIRIKKFCDDKTFAVHSICKVFLMVDSYIMDKRLEHS